MINPRLAYWLLKFVHFSNRCHLLKHQENFKIQFWEFWFMIKDWGDYFGRNRFLTKLFSKTIWSYQVILQFFWSYLFVFFHIIFQHFFFKQQIDVQHKHIKPNQQGQWYLLHVMIWYKYSKIKDHFSKSSKVQYLLILIIDN